MCSWADNFCLQRWKNYWNRTVFAKVMLKCSNETGCSFFDSQCKSHSDVVVYNITWIYALLLEIRCRLSIQFWHQLPHRLLHSNHSPSHFVRACLTFYFHHRPLVYFSSHAENSLVSQILPTLDCFWPDCLQTLRPIRISFACHFFLFHVLFSSVLLFDFDLMRCLLVSFVSCRVCKGGINKHFRRPPSFVFISLCMYPFSKSNLKKVKHGQR